MAERPVVMAERPVVMAERPVAAAERPVAADGTPGQRRTRPVADPSSMAPPPTGPGGTGTPPKVVTTVRPTKPPRGSLAFTGLNLQRDAEIGAALIAGGWAMQYWASRVEKERPTS